MPYPLDLIVLVWYKIIGYILYSFEQVGYTCTHFSMSMSDNSNKNI